MNCSVALHIFVIKEFNHAIVKYYARNESTKGA